MHEFSLASQIWSSVRIATEAHGGGRVLSIKLEVGALNLLAEEQLTFWIGTLAERDGSPDLHVDITLLPGRIQCQACQMESELSPPTESMEHLLPTTLHCPACQSPQTTVIGGREIRVVSAEIEPAT